MTSQKNLILQALLEGQRLTPLNALIRFHCLSLSQRVGQLRREGYPIAREMVKIGHKRVAEYSWKKYA